MPSNGLMSTEMENAIPQQFEFGTDFLEADSAAIGTITKDTETTVAVDADGVGGVLQITTPATNNHEGYWYSNEIFKIANNKPIRAIARISYTEAATSAANVFFGLVDAPVANTLVDDGAGMKSSWDGAVIYKVDGGTLWKVKSSRATTATDETTNVAAGGTFSFMIDIVPISSTEAQVIYYIDATGGNNFKQCYANGSHPNTPAIKQTITYASTTEIAVAVGLKAGSATAEVLNVDFIYAKQVR
jgi:hypothetical protein